MGRYVSVYFFYTFCCGKTDICDENRKGRWSRAIMSCGWISTISVFLIFHLRQPKHLRSKIWPLRASFPRQCENNKLTLLSRYHPLKKEKHAIQQRIRLITIFLTATISHQITHNVREVSSRKSPKLCCQQQALTNSLQCMLPLPTIKKLLEITKYRTQFIWHIW
jgi:hypothetical protein